MSNLDQLLDGYLNMTLKEIAEDRKRSGTTEPMFIIFKDNVIEQYVQGDSLPRQHDDKPKPTVDS